MKLEDVNLEFLNLAAKEIHKMNKEKGFYDEPKEVGTALMLIVSELGEAMEAYREGERANKDKYIKSNGYNMSVTDFKTMIKDTFEDEIADTMIRLFDLAGWLGIDLDFHIKMKLKYNRRRPYKHGKLF